MYCDNCGKLLPMGIQEYGNLAESYQEVECGSCRHMPERSTELLSEFSRRQTVKV